jgi:hypothetical protein
MLETERKQLSLRFGLGIPSRVLGTKHLILSGKFSYLPARMLIFNIKPITKQPRLQLF